MLKMVDGTGIIGVDMICPLGVSTPQPPNYDRVELEGTGMLVLPNSLDAPLERLELGGKTEQVQTSGKNLLPDKFSIYAEGKSKTNLKLQIGNYVYSSKTSKNLYILHEDKSNITNGWTDTNKFNFKIDKEETIEVRIETENPLEILPMIRAETESDSYEPYTGGKPSPSPEYPQEIKSVGKWNESTQKYEIEVVLSGKNPLDITACEDGKTLDANGNIVNNANALLSDFIPCFSKTSYCRVEGHFTAVSFYDVEKNKIGFINQYDPCFATPDKCRYFRFSLNKTKADYEKAVANVGTALMDYEPYKKPQTLTLTSDRPLTKWDRLVEQGGQIGWLYGSKIYVVTGNEVFESRDGYNIESYTNRHFILNDLLMENDALKPLAYMKCLRNVQYVYSANIFEEGFETNKNQFHIKLSNDRVGILASDDHAVRTAKFSEYMKKIHKNGNPIEILYATTDTVFLPLPQEEQNAIRALKTYYPTTVITADGGELDPDIKVTYRKEI